MDINLLNKAKKFMLRDKAKFSILEMRKIFFALPKLLSNIMKLLAPPQPEIRDELSRANDKIKKLDLPDSNSLYVVA